MPAEPDLDPLHGRLTFLLKRAFFDLEQLHEEHLAPSGIDVRELTVLLFLTGREPGSQQQTAQDLGVDRTTMVALLDSLERKGLVLRRPDSNDRRRNVVVVTDAGRKVLRRATRASDRAEGELLADLSETEAAQLRAILKRLATRGT